MYGTGCRWVFGAHLSLWGAPLVHPAPYGLSPLQILGTTCSWTALASSPTSASVTATLPSCSATAMSSRVRADSSYCCHKLPLSRYEYVSMGLRHMNPKPCAAVAESIGCQVDVKWLWPSVLLAQSLIALFVVYGTCIDICNRSKTALF